MKHTGKLPPEQELIRAKCFHPSGTFVAFTTEETEQSIPSRFEKMARLYPSQTAVKSQTGILTYEALNATANRIAHRLLRQCGDKPEPIALLAEHDELTVAAMMGILKAGKICMPLDPSHSRERLALTLKDAQAVTVVVSKKNRDRLTGLAEVPSPIVSDDEINSALPAENPSVPISPDALAYIEYTSGSTGEPKGIMQSHRVKLHRVLRNTNSLHICALDRIALFSYLVTAWGSQASLNALLNGAPLALFDIREEGFLPLAHWLRRERITIYASAPTLFRSLANTLLDANPFPEIRSVRLNGERILRGDVEIFKQHFSPGCILEVSFAASETGTFCQYFLDKQSVIAGDTVPVGYPEDRMELLILNDARETVGVGVSGEIAIKSPCCSIGYWRRPEETAAKFLVDPAGSDPRVFMTGDLGRLRPDGCLEYLGRKDFLVKVRGYRVELGEVEEALRSCEGVQEAAVVFRSANGEEGRLIAYVVSNGISTISATSLRRVLKERLPDYMIPAAFILLDTMPTTATGKIDRQALPDLDKSRPALDLPYVEPRTGLEKQLAKIWGEVLSIDPVGIHDNFFDLGGHSLAATRVISRLIQEFHLELPIKKLFESPTVAAMSAVIVQSQENQETIARRANRALAPLSYAQQRLWFVHQLEPESSAYNEAMALRLQGSVNVEALKRALNLVVERHETLRTSYAVSDGGSPVQSIGKSRPVDLHLFDLSADTGKERAVETQRMAAELKGRPFNLCRDLLLRAGLIRFSSNEHFLVVIMHHIASDAWSTGIFWRELASLYEAFSQGQPNPLPELSIQYADYAVWQRQWLQGEVLEKQLSYWKEHLAGIPVLELPTDRPRPAVQTYRGAKQSLDLPRSLSDQLKALSSQNGVTLFMTLLAAFQTLLHRHTGQEDIVIGTPIAGRNRVELENIIGFFVNTLVVRTDFTGEPTFQELLTRVREVALGAYAHQDLPFEKLVEELQPERTVGTSPLFQVTFGFQNLQEETFPFPGMTVTRLEVDSSTAKFDLSLRIREQANGLRAVLEYNTDLFDAATIDRMLGQYQKLLESIVKDPSQRISEMPILTEGERYQLLTEWNRTDVEYPSHRCVHELFEEQAQRKPAAVAAVFDDRQLTYAELNARANQLARHLRKFGVGPDILVGLCMERSVEMVVGLLGILKAGGAYVPLDPDYPRERLAFILNDTRAPVFITQKRLMEHRRWTLEESDSRPAPCDRQIQVICLDNDWDKIASESDDNLETLTGTQHLAYLIYTSGSSGMPKGVAVEHKSLLNYSLDIVRRLQPETGSHFAMVQPLTVDSCITMIFPCLATGGALHIISREKALNAAVLSEYFRRESIDFLKIAPSHLAALQALPSATGLLPRRCLIIGGEGSRWDWVESLQARAPSCTIYNHYGPTETTVGVLMYRVRESLTKKNFLHTPLGRPIANTQVYLLDKHLRPVPVGVTGELYIGGDGLARGYCNRPELTGEKFIPHSFNGEPPRRLYKTGDLARYFPDGNIEFLGRVDNQVKIRGYRIEPGEIESVVRQHPGVRETVVTVREDEPGNKRLIAYVVLENDFALKSFELHSYLKDKLPHYMMPSAFVFLDALPLTPHGKLNQRALPAPEHSRPELAERYQAPRNPVEESLARIWAEVLKLEKVGVHDNFFDLGGHSLKAVQVVSRACKAFEVDLPLRRLFETPTIVGLAEGIETLLWAKHTAAPRDDALTSEEESGEV